MALDQKATSASWGGGHGPLGPPLDPPLTQRCLISAHHTRPLRPLYDDDDDDDDECYSSYAS